MRKAIEVTLPPLTATIQDGVDYVVRIANNGGGECPCCRQRVQMYDRQINSSMAQTLIKFHQVNGMEWGHLRASDHSREGSKLRHWGLIENEKILRPDGGRSGWWRITATGRSFVLGELRVPKTVWIYDNELMRVDYSEGTIDIRDALGNNFNYSELMSSSPS
jgi:hypothetical protein